MNFQFKIHLKYEGHYLCNWACISRERKMTYKWEEVTCKNCLKEKNKMVKAGHSIWKYKR
ncbi:MAG TPA: hypothetical protein VMZ91_01660 [Candidatus Paceibacterota bacterium]|nr:hypothetical protein [Candidatus Paceibacterota bacterium]